MTPADLARNNAISFECKKDALQQRQSGDWKISFTVQGIDMDDRLTRAPMGTRFVAVLVEINDQELPVTPVEKEKKPISISAATPQPVTPDKPLVEAKRETETRMKRDWNSLQPSTQAGMRSHDPRFEIFLEEEYPDEWGELQDAAECIRSICGVKSRSEFGSDQRKRVLWHQLDQRYNTWLLKERVGA